MQFNNEEIEKLKFDNYNIEFPNIANKKYKNLIMTDDISMKGLKFSIKENTDASRTRSIGCASKNLSNAKLS